MDAQGGITTQEYGQNQLSFRRNIAPILQTQAGRPKEKVRGRDWFVKQRK